jgi:heme-degrading monooxygenase HmoA
MIARVFQATATADGTERYRRHFTTTVLPQLRGIDGFRDAQLLERPDGERTEIWVITRWESMAKVHNFAGDDTDVAVVEPAAIEALSDYQPTVAHFTVSVD